MRGVGGAARRGAVHFRLQTTRLRGPGDGNEDSSAVPTAAVSPRGRGNRPDLAMRVGDAAVDALTASARRKLEGHAAGPTHVRFHQTAGTWKAAQRARDTGAAGGPAVRMEPGGRPAGRSALCPPGADPGDRPGCLGDEATARLTQLTNLSLKCTWVFFYFQSFPLWRGRKPLWRRHVPRAGGRHTDVPEQGRRREPGDSATY